MQETNDEKLRELAIKLQQLTREHQNLAAEINQLSQEIDALRSKPKNVLPTQTILTEHQSPPRIKLAEQPQQAVQPQTPPPARVITPRVKTPLEEFIGTNLLNKIGIAVLVIGLGIGAKYAIDNDLIDPLTRIVLGYLAGVVLILLAIRLKKNYKNFSAVLLSGGMATLYFMTFAAYSFYELVPQPIAFALMVLFTIFTVFAALHYNAMAIAIIGLVGAYAVPFLLSDGSGKVGVLFAYITIVNAGILVLSFKKTWKPLYYTAFVLTWLIYSGWFIDQYRVEKHLSISLLFSTLFFLSFYTIFLAYKLLQRESLTKADITVLLVNSFAYFGWGYYAIDAHAEGELFTGIFTVFNAILHFVACVLIKKRQQVSPDTFYFVAGMVLVFLTLAVPIQLDGHWVTLLWAFEALLLFGIGRIKNFPVYEKISYVLVLLTIVSLSHDWDTYYPSYFYGQRDRYISFLLNIQFLSSILVCATWGGITYIAQRNRSENTDMFSKVFSWAMPAVLIVMLFLSVYKEIDIHWQQRYYLSAIQTGDNEYEYTVYNTDLLQYGQLWLTVYTAIFLSSLWFVNKRFTRNKYLAYTVAGFAALTVVSFITQGLSALVLLRNSYLFPEQERYYEYSVSNVLFRYLCIVAVLPLLYAIYNTVQQDHVTSTVRKAERIFFHVMLLALLTSELINVLELLHIQNSDRLAVSILWGTYALVLIVYGLLKHEKFIRITAISTFGITLFKLFFYDMAAMDTIAKTLVMVILGALLLAASFLYNKFKPASHER